MRCPRCGSENCQILSETTTTGSDYSAGLGCLGALIFGPIGAICGACGDGKETRTRNFWYCTDCGKKFSL